MTALPIKYKRFFFLGDFSGYYITFIIIFLTEAIQKINVRVYIQIHV